MTEAIDLFHRTFPEAIGAQAFSAPGRVNLIGEHTDYNNGLVLPFAIDARTHVVVARNELRTVRVVSAQRPDEIRTIAVDRIDPETAGSDWSAYVFGVLWAFADSGREVGGIDLAISSTVPVGAGLSSSAALECAVGLAVSTVFGHDLSLDQIARLAQRAENDYVGMPCGLMDQMASATCEQGNVLFFDVGADTCENIPFDPESDGLSVLVIDTRAHHSLADGEYAKRRASCEQAAATLGIESLRDITFDGLDAALARLDDALLRRRVRHIVTENRRVERVVEQLRHAGAIAIGPDLTASHVSLRDDFEVSCLELDVAVDAALTAGALGARMTGGGFGGSVVALVPHSAKDRVSSQVLAAFAARSLTAPVIRTVTPAQGARRD
ncbi:galactokinase [Nakamurella panacisegetis]|uniref:Galactokinase n=1 Tax=Nakamurella panacisegetis TaxID=1090615 RepID=A0A1H0M7E1_9ACTN|nr:galactokinase [Nakamurella panacisegetis]SDO76265.1 galactokinase [Nakamurella panacisegetis]